MDPDPVSCLDVVRMGLLGKPRTNRLLGREESLLRLGCFVEPSCSTCPRYLRPNLGTPFSHLNAFPGYTLRLIRPLNS